MKGRLIAFASILAAIAVSGIATARSPDLSQATAATVQQQEATCTWGDSTTTVHGSGSTARMLQNLSTQVGTGELRSLRIDESGALRSVAWRAPNDEHDPSLNRAAKARKLLGSRPIVVGAPTARQFDEVESKSYEAFSRVHRDRPEVVYAITDEGVLQGYETATGLQVNLAPDARSSPISRPESDGTSAAYLAVSDVFFAGDWHSVAVATAGNTLFAVDVTSPAAFGEATSAAKALLWEFARPSGATSVRSISQPVIAKLRTGIWAVIVGIEFDHDGSMSSGRESEAALYVLDIASGQVVRTFEIPEHANERNSSAVNALAAPAAVNAWPGDAIEYVYAGDRQGRLWKFDLTASLPERWHLALDVEPVFQARDRAGRPQAIVTRPEVIRDSSGTDLLVFFGTGTQDGSDASGASFYGIVDNGRTGPVRSDMQHLQLAQQASSDMPNAPMTRLVGVNDPVTKPGRPRGWYLDLPAETNEQFATHPIARNSKLIFSTQQAGGSSCDQRLRWTFVLDISRRVQLNGASSSLEINDAGSTPVLAGSAVATLGYGTLGLGLPPVAQTVDPQGRCVLRIYPVSARPGDAPVIASCHDQTQGRQSWRQLR